MKLVARGLTCSRNGRELFHDLSFAVGPGELVAVRGANGAGKSSLLRLLAGLVLIEAGALEIEGQNEDDLSLAQRLHLVAHQDAMKPALTVAENLHFWCDMLGGTSIAAALASFHLAPLQDEAVQLLSAGQRRRLTLSRLFLAHRPLWLLDEPATALDADSQSVLLRHMETHLAEGGSIIAAIHGETGLTPTRTLTIAPRQLA